VSDPLVVASVNVNGVRAAFRRGMDAWLEWSHPDVLLLQEVRADTDVLLAHLDRLGGSWHVVHEGGPAAGRAGVAVASRLPTTAVRVGLGGVPAESGGRWVEADVVTPAGTSLTVVSTYVHTATARTPSMAVKLGFLEQVSRRMSELASGSVVVGGDLNVAHDARDIKNWKGNRGKSGFLPQEQAHLTSWQDHGWVDAGRAHAGDVEGPYTWWSWRGRAYDNDAGWRIDYLWCSPALAGRIGDVTVDRAASYEGRFSDHAPVRMLLRV
jgi:exodeoxyribonuclease-3